MGLIEDIQQLAQGDPTLQGIISSDNSYIDQLIGEAQGNLNFALKKLDAEHKLALGSDDQARATFLEKVADQLEQRIGRIPYDYERYTNRELQDYAQNTGRVQSDQKTALQRLDEDEQVLRQQADTEAAQARQDQAGDLNSRGILSSTRENATGLAGKNVKDLENKINLRAQDITRATTRDRQDINEGAARSLTDLGVAHNRSLEDITALARRGAIDQQQATDFGKEGANLDFQSQQTALERERKRLLAQAPSSATYLNELKGGYG